MKKLFALSFVFAAASGLHAYGISPSRAEQGAAQNQQSTPFQLQPGAQTSNNLMAPGQPQPGQPQIKISNEQAIEDNIKNYHPADWAKSWGHVTIAEAKALHADSAVLFADARPKVEYDQGHIPGAIPLPYTEFDKYYKLYESRLHKAKKIVTYCHGLGCMLSDKVAQKLYEQKKLHNVVGFFGGWPQWKDNNLPIEVGTGPGKKN